MVKTNYLGSLPKNGNNVCQNPTGECGHQQLDLFEVKKYLGMDLTKLSIMRKLVIQTS
jgi:hypothetical protein